MLETLALMKANTFPKSTDANVKYMTPKGVFPEVLIVMEKETEKVDFYMDIICVSVRECVNMKLFLKVAHLQSDAVNAFDSVNIFENVVDFVNVSAC